MPDDKTTPPNACTKCQKRWGGMNTAHCSACHRTFTGITAFDAHRKGGTCSDPTTIGLVENGRDYECFGYPADPTREFPKGA